MFLAWVFCIIILVVILFYFIFNFWLHPCYTDRNWIFFFLLQNIILEIFESCFYFSFLLFN